MSEFKTVTVEITADDSKFQRTLNDVELAIIDFQDRRRVRLADTINLAAKAFEDHLSKWVAMCSGVPAETVTLAEMAGLFEGGPGSVEWVREQRDR